MLPLYIVIGTLIAGTSLRGLLYFLDKFQHIQRNHINETPHVLHLPQMLQPIAEALQSAEIPTTISEVVHEILPNNPELAERITAALPTLQVEYVSPSENLPEVIDLPQIEPVAETPSVPQTPPLPHPEVVHQTQHIPQTEPVLQTPPLPQTESLPNAQHDDKAEKALKKKKKIRALLLGEILFD